LSDQPSLQTFFATIASSLYLGKSIVRRSIKLILVTSGGLLALIVLLALYEAASISGAGDWLKSGGKVTLKLHLGMGTEIT
jgi:hypothetical protein